MMFLISFYMLAVLCMPATFTNIIGTIFLCLLVTIGYCWKYKPANMNGECGSVMQYAIVDLMLLGQQGFKFYERWSCSSKVKSIADRLYLSNDAMLIFIDIILLIGGSYCIVQGWNKLSEYFENKLNYINLSMDLNITACLVNALPQMMLGIKVGTMGFVKYFIGVLFILTCSFVLYAITGKVRLAMILPAIVFGALATANAYVYSFRSVLLEPTDFMSAKTAWNVIDNYSFFPVPMQIAAAWCLLIGWVIHLVRRKNHFEKNLLKKMRKVSAVLGGILTVGLAVYILNLHTYHWMDEGAFFNCYYLDFLAKVKELKVEKPSGYQTEELNILSEKYKNQATEGQTPHIIVVMNESFADLNVIGELKTNIEVMPYISDLVENTIWGYALSSVFGGNTANSEYEFLTGNSMAWFPANTIPYQQYMGENTYSVVRYLKQEYDYECIAMHPFSASGWNRTNVYSYLGFNQQMFLEDFPGQKLWRNYISDEEMFEEMIRVYEEKKENPIFLFGITMQNHGGYEYDGENCKQTVYINSQGKYPKAEQYLSCIHETDQAVEMLLEYFKSVEEDVVIVFFGDHLPKIEEEFYEELNEGEFDSLEERLNRYRIPFFVWANYDIEEQQIECSSINYLSNYMYEAAGIPLPPYNQFLSDLEEIIPAMNSIGYLSKETAGFQEYEETSEEERQWLSLYNKLQYNAVFDQKNIISAFFW